MKVDLKQHAPATERNREAILAMLREVLPESGVVLEIASGSGQHACFFAKHLPQLQWQPTDLDPESLVSINAWVAEAGLENLLPALKLDVHTQDWNIEHVDACLCINMIHISPWSASVALFEGCARVLAAGAPLISYGPYKINGEHTAPSNERFEGWLKGLNSEYGVRDIGKLKTIAEQHGFVLERQVSMPANNFTLIWRRNT